MATYCIGDVQGCYSELFELLNLIGASTESDKLWFVGDLVNRGKDSLSVLRLVKEMSNAIVVLGNHDLHLLALHYQVIHPASHTLHAVLAAHDRDDLIDWLRFRPLLHYDEFCDYVLVHAGIYPWWDLAAAQKYGDEVAAILRSSDREECAALFANMYSNQPDVWHDDLTGWERRRFIINCFTRMRFCDAHGRLDLTCQGAIGAQPGGYMPWFEVSQRKVQDKKIVFGHWAALEGKVTVPNVFALDTGCVWGGTLTAMRLEDGARFCVPCRVK